MAINFSKLMKKKGGAPALPPEMAGMAPPDASGMGALMGGAPAAPKPKSKPKRKGKKY